MGDEKGGRSREASPPCSLRRWRYPENPMTRLRFKDDPVRWVETLPAPILYACKGAGAGAMYRLGVRSPTDRCTFFNCPS
jgi:hypothetical protein